MLRTIPTAIPRTVAIETLDVTVLLLGETTER